MRGVRRYIGSRAARARVGRGSVEIPVQTSREWCLAAPFVPRLDRNIGLIAPDERFGHICANISGPPGIGS
jgi:hypothetical protein